MNWILIAVVSNTILSSGFADKEACAGRVATLAEQKIVAKCVEAPRASAFTTGTVTMTPCGYLGSGSLCSK